MRSGFSQGSAKARLQARTGVQAQHCHSTAARRGQSPRRSKIPTFTNRKKTQIQPGKWSQLSSAHQRESALGPSHALPWHSPTMVSLVLDPGQAQGAHDLEVPFACPRRDLLAAATPEQTRRRQGT